MQTNRRNFLKVATALSGAMLMPPKLLAQEGVSNGLSASAESAIAELWQFEKLRGDLAALFAKTFPQSDLLEQLGHFASTNRRAVYNELVKLYQIDLSTLPDATLLYTNEQIIAMKAGTFASTKLQNRYDTYKNEGMSSLEDAYNVLVKIAVDTITAIQQYQNEHFNANAKIGDNLSYLADGSMGHYWALDRELKKMGVSQGCCALGKAYCKTPNEYPVSLGTSHSDAPKLTDEQRHALAHMWSEEKMAHDAFEVVYAVYPHLRLFYNIGHWSEVQHMTAVEELIAFYNFDVLEYQNQSGTYDAAKLRKMDKGKYAISDFEDRYNNTLLPYAVKGDMYALKLGCMVEVQDIWDLEGFLGQNTGDSFNQYIDQTFRYLIAGSQSHYWAYHYALVERGEKQGCCCLGEDYCKTPKEYPSGSGDRVLAKLWNRNDQPFEKFGRKFSYAYA